jgi:hypothetical protein
MQQDQLARSESEQRYLDQVSGLQGTRDRVLGQLKDYGQSLTSDVNRNADLSLRNQISDLTSRGLGASTIRSSITNASDRERNAELRRIQDDITAQKTAADERLSNSLYGVMERRTDVQPNAGQLAQLSQGLGQAGYGYGGPPSAYQMGQQYQPQPYYSNIPMGGGGSMLATPGWGQPMNQYNQYGQQRSPFGGTKIAPYSAPPMGANGLDNPLSSAIDRYGQRQAAPQLPGYTGGYGGYGGYPQLPNYGAVGQFGGSMSMGLNETSTAQSKFAAAQKSQSDAAAYAKRNTPWYDDPKLRAESDAAGWLWRNRINPGYGGYGSNDVQVVDSRAMPAQNTNLGYGNPASQLNSVYNSYLGSLPQFPTMPGNWPLGQARVRRTV